MISKYLGDCPDCAGKVIIRYRNNGEHVVCKTCHETGKPVVVEYEEIKDVPEGYEFKGNITFGDLELAEFKKVSSTGLVCYVLHRKLPYKIGSIDEYVCEECGGRGWGVSVMMDEKGIPRWSCPACKGKCKIKRKILDITVEKVGCIGCCVHKTDWASGICDVTDCDDGCPLTKEEIAKAPKCKDCKGKDNFQFEIKRAMI